MLSIVILFCDRDYKYIPYLLEVIKDRVRINHEVVLIDNRENNHDDIDTNGCIYYAFGFNATQVQGRKKGVELAKGDYIWFVDGDDEVVEITPTIGELMNHDYDIIAFMAPEKDNLQEKNICNYITLHCLGVMLWNKWIKTSLLRKAEELIPTDLYGSASEDMMVVVGCLKFAKSIWWSTFRPYIYIRERSCCAVEKITSVEQYKRIINGYASVTAQITKMLTSEEQQGLSWPQRKYIDSLFFLRKLLICEDSILTECAVEYAKYFDVALFSETWIRYSMEAPIIMTCVQYNDIKARLKKALPLPYIRQLDARNVVRLYGVGGKLISETIKPLPDWSIATNKGGHNV